MSAPLVAGLFDPDPGQWRVLAQVAIGMTLGAVLGAERQAAGKPAGMRTHMLVAGAAVLFVGVADVVVTAVAAGMPAEVRPDPLRIIEAIVAGTSFLGAGTIIRHRDGETVEGITTAASLLLTAAIGVCVALGQLIAAAGTTALVLATLRVLGRLEPRTPTGRTHDEEDGDGRAAARGDARDGGGRGHGLPAG